MHVVAELSNSSQTFPTDHVFIKCDSVPHIGADHLNKVYSRAFCSEEAQRPAQGSLCSALQLFGQGRPIYGPMACSTSSTLWVCLHYWFISEASASSGLIPCLSRWVGVWSFQIDLPLQTFGISFCGSSWWFLWMHITWLLPRKKSHMISIVRHHVNILWSKTVVT